MDILSRLREILQYSGLSVRAFAIKCGISQTTLDKQIKGLRSVSLETVLSILYAYPEISSEWLLHGEGDMFKTATTDINAERVMKMVDTINTLQDTINSKDDTIALLNKRIKQLESQSK